MLKQHLLRQLQKKLRDTSVEAENLALQVAQEAKSGAQRAINLSKGTNARALQARSNFDTIDHFQPKDLREGEKIGLGAIVEIEDGQTGKTLFIAPTGAGIELTGPGDDGFFHVITPASPLGKKIIHQQVGHSFELPMGDELVEYTIVFAQ